MKSIAFYKTKGNDWLELFDNGPMTHPDHIGMRDYSYRGNGCGGGFCAPHDVEAISRFEAPWGDKRGVGQVTVLKSDRPSLKRIR
jgi:hypothetical protein